MKKRILTSFILSSIIMMMMSVEATANTVAVKVTASNQITNIPVDFGAPRFVLDKPWFSGELPGFPISLSFLHLPMFLWHRFVYRTECPSHQHDCPYRLANH